MSDFIEGVTKKVPDNSDILSELLDSMNDMLKNFSTMSENMNKTYSQASGKVSNTYIRSGKYTHTPFSDEQKEILKHFESQIRTLNAYVQTATDQIDKAFKNNEKAIEYFTKYLKDDNKFKKEMKGVQKEYAKEFVKYQDRHMLQSFGDAFLRESPLLRRVFGKIMPGQEGTAQAQREKERLDLKNTYLKKGEGFFEQSKRRFVLGESEASSVKEAEDVSKGLEFDLANQKRKFAFENLGINFTMPGGVGGFGPTGTRPSDMFSSGGKEDMPAKADPSKGDLMKLSGKWVNGSIYVGNIFEDRLKKVLKKMDDNNFGNLLEGQKGLLEKIGGGGGLGAIAGLMSLLPKLLPILSAAALASGVIVGLIALLKIGGAEDKAKQNTESTGLLKLAGFSREDYSKDKGIDAKSDFSVEDVKAWIEEKKGPGFRTYQELIQTITEGRATKEQFSTFSKALSDSNMAYKILGGDFLNYRVEKTPKGTYLVTIGDTTKEVSSEDGINKMKVDLMGRSSTFKKWMATFGGKPTGEYFDKFISEGNIFHTGGTIPGNRGEEVGIKALAGEVVLSPKESLEYEKYKKEKSNTVGIPNTSDFKGSDRPLLEKVSELVEINRQLLEEMKINTKTLDKKEFTKNESTVSPVQQTKMRITSY